MVPPNANLPSASANSTGGRFNGDWKGQAGTNHKGCLKFLDTEIRVAGSHASGQMSFISAYGKVPIAGTISGDGSMAGTLGGAVFSGRFEGDHFKGAWLGGTCGGGFVQLDRVK